MKIFPIIPIWLMILICLGLFILSCWKEKRKKFLIKQVFIIGLLFLINLRIMIPAKEAMAMSNNLDVLFVVDNTLSMIAEDYQGTNPRMEGVKKDCEFIIDELSGARFSVIVFNNSSQILTPYTKDINITKESIEIIHPPEELYAKGSRLDISLEDMEMSLKKSKDGNDNIRIVFYISDGEINSKNEMSSFKSLKKYIDNGSVLGYGTTSGGYMKVIDYYTEQEEYLEDTSDYPYKKAVSKINETTLKKIAKELGIDYINMNNGQNSLKTKLNEIKKMEKNTYKKYDLINYQYFYYLFLIPLLSLLVLKYRELQNH